MHIALFVLGIIAFLAGIGTCTMAKGAIHEIEGLIWCVAAAVFISGAAVVEAVNRVRKATEGRAKTEPPTKES